MAEFKGARTVTDKFSLRDLIRKHTPQNRRNYLFDAVNRTINAPVTKERIALGEMYGYYGHGRREEHYNKTGSLRLPEFSVIMVEGTPVPVNNIPSNRTLAIRLDGDIVTHTQEILDTDTGRIVNGMESGNVGGWSWATSGPTNAQGAHVRVFEGFDYVTTPNFISLNKQIPMLESAGDREAAIIRQCISQGFSENAAVDIAHHFERMREHAMFEEANALLPVLEGQVLMLEGELTQSTELLAAKNAMLESVTKAEETRKAALGDFIRKLPVFLTSAQKEALERMETPDDMRVVTALFESVLQPNLPGSKWENTPAPGSVRKPAPAQQVGFMQPHAGVPRFE